MGTHLESIKLAIKEFGGKVLGKRVEVIVADTQNKPDIAPASLRRTLINK